MESSPGAMKKIMTALFAAVLALAMASCKEQKQEKPRAALVRTSKAVQKDIPLEIRAIGEAEALSSVEVRSQVSGPIVKVHIQEGQYVGKGAPLFTIDPRPFEVTLKQAQAQLARDRAQHEKAMADARRYDELVQKGYVAQAEYEQFRTAAAALGATVEADMALVEKARIELGYCYIRAPFAGKTGSIAFDQGNIIRPGDAAPLGTIFQVEPIYVNFTVPEQDFAAIRSRLGGKPLKVSVATGSFASYEGELTFVDNSVDRATGTIKLKGTVRNRDRGLWPGQFVNVSLRLDVERGAVAVPSKAVMTGQDGQYVFVIGKDMAAEVRPVQSDRAYGDETVIKTGLAPGETVVTEGQLQLAPGMKVQLKEAGPAAGK